MSRIAIIRRSKLVLALAFAVALLNSCIFKDEKDHHKNRTVLIYICAENNLWSMANSNLYSMNSSIGNGMDNYNLLVYMDCRGMTPALIHVHNFQIDTIAKYPERNSADPAVMRSVIDEVLQNWKAEHYGLVLWSHGTGWLPADKLHFVAPNMGYAPRRRAFALEDNPGQTPAYTCMELDELAEAIPDDVFDFILFDACYMGNVEVAFALRNKANQIVSSACEIVSYGFPYHVVTRDLLNNNMLKTCNEFFDYYNSMSGFNKTAGISLVNTAGLDSLARCFRKIINEYGYKVPTMNVKRVQCFDRFNNHTSYDLENFVEAICENNDYMNEFRLQLQSCVPYKVSTPILFPGDPDQIVINSYCGMSVFIPRPEYEESGLNEAYRQTEWSDYTDYR